MLGLRTILPRPTLGAALSLLLVGCISDTIGGEGGPGEDPSASATSGDDPGATSQGSATSPSSGYEPCGTGGCEGGITSWTTGEWTTGATGATAGTDTLGDDGPGPLITTGNEDATEWNVTVRHAFTGRAPQQGVYLTTTLVSMESDFYSVVEIPTGTGAWYGYFDGDYDAGMVTIVDGGVAGPGVSVAGTLQITESTLEGSGTFSDAMTDDLMGTWEILDATPLP
ncbi:MAG: hypothetical protein AB1Z98_16440 [Nannocystaceae bacterium]